MSKQLVVIWESYRDGRANTLIADSRPQANLIADSYRTSRRRRVDVVPLNSANLRRITNS
jgi:hypothetical protein